MLKTFQLTQDEEVNAFLETVTEPQITITDNAIVVNYQTTKADYSKYFVNFLIDSTKRNLFNEVIRKVALDAEIEELKERTNYPEYDELVKKQKDANQTIKRFEAKIKALEAWQTSNS